MLEQYYAVILMFIVMLILLIPCLFDLLRVAVRLRVP
jgi:hypothetical protein